MIGRQSVACLRYGPNPIGLLRFHAGMAVMRVHRHSPLINLNASVQSAHEVSNAAKENASIVAVSRARQRIEVPARLEFLLSHSSRELWSTCIFDDSIISSFNGSLVQAHCKPNAEGISRGHSAANALYNNDLATRQSNCDRFVEWIVYSQ